MHTKGTAVNEMMVGRAATAAAAAAAAAEGAGSLSPTASVLKNPLHSFF